MVQVQVNLSKEENKIVSQKKLDDELISKEQAIKNIIRESEDERK